MQDIDFDELDRAVNSVSNSGTPAPSPKPERSDDDREVEVPERSNPVPPAARRRSGRFMDVVHPSSDMRPNGPATRAEAPKKEPVPAPVAPAPSMPTPEAEVPSNDDFNWPDPLEVASKNDTPKAGEAPAEPAQTDDPSAPLETPFLADTKVEKRPLGAFSDAKPALDLTDVLNEDADGASAPAAETSAPEAVEPAEPAAAPAPADLESLDDSALEVSEEALIGSGESSDTSPDETPADTPAEKPAEAATPAPETSPKDYDPPASATLGAASIPQQYKEQPSTTDQPSGAIYDTEAYHKPLAHPQKKKSGLLVLVWILALIVLGGGLGAALYFFVLPML